MTRYLLHALVLTLCLLVPTVAQAQSQDDVIATIQAAAERYGVSGAYMSCIARLESGYNPRAVGALGEQGLYQLLAGGLRDTFYARGYSDVWSVEQQSEFVGWALSRGMDAHWQIASRRCR